MYPQKKVRSRGLVRVRAHGQSIPLIALMILVLFGMVGLAVDVGNTYAENQRVVSATRAASISGLTAYKNNANDQQIRTIIEQSLTSNGVPLSGNRRLEAFYLNSDGEQIQEVGSGSVPGNASFIQVTVEGETDTYFARLVGRPTLPVNASGYAGSCPASTGVYPFTVPSSLIANGAFDLTNVPQAEGGDASAKDGNYRGFTWRRVYLNENKSNDDNDFIPSTNKSNWVRWTNASWSQTELANALADDGNIAVKYEEAAWPNGVTPVPSPYPIQPGSINAGDWVSTVPGAKSSSAVRSTLEGHITAGTIMTLPIYQDVAGQGNNGAVKITLLGSFVLVGYNDANNSDPYFDLIYLGPASDTACSMTPTKPDKLGLVGSVSYLPGYQTSATDYQPVQYVVILDVSGSMVMNFTGQGKVNGVTTQCLYNGGDSFAQCNLSKDTGNYKSGSLALSAWTPKEERRIYLAKNAIGYLIDRMNISGAPNYDATLPADQMKIVGFNADLETGGSTTWGANDSNRVALLKTVYGDGTNYPGGTGNPTENGAGSTSRKSGKETDPYLVDGGTNGAIGLYRAAKMLEKRQPTVSHNGKTYTYRPVVVFLTDGVSNNFFHTSSETSGLGTSNDATISKGKCNGKGDTYITNNPECQLNEISGTYSKDGKTLDRPVTAMKTVRDTYLKQHTNYIFAVALSALPNNGLQTNIATQPSYYYEMVSYSANGLNEIFNQINQVVERGNCIPNYDTNFKTTMSAAEAPTSGGYSYPNKVGIVEAYDTSGTLLATANIQADGQGKLSYSFAQLPRGVVTLVASLYYHDARDKFTAATNFGNGIRQYNKFQEGLEVVDFITVDISPTGQFGAIEKNLQLKLNTDVCSS